MWVVDIVCVRPLSLSRRGGGVAGRCGWWTSRVRAISPSRLGAGLVLRRRSLTHVCVAIRDDGRGDGCETLPLLTEDDLNDIGLPRGAVVRLRRHRVECTPRNERPLADCVICLADDGARHAIVPCGHRCVCRTCAAVLAMCPICRTPAERTLEIFDVG